MKALSFIVLFLSLLASKALCCTPSDSYVTTTGSDTNTGTVSSPFLTVNHAIGVATPGTVIHIGTGTYAENGTFSSQSGTTGAGCNITLTSLTGQGAKLKTIYINNSNFITISNLDLSNQTATAYPNGYGIHIDGTSHDITLTNNNIHELCHEGIFMQATVGGNNIISGNTILKAQMTGMNISGNTGAAAFGGGTSVFDNDISQTQQRPQALGGIYAACNAFAIGDDADWMRLFGSGHTIGKPGHGNNLHDIPHGTTANPTGANEAHTDCFQSFVSGTPALDHTIIEGNACRGSDTAAHTAWIIEAGDLDGNGCSGCLNNVLLRNNTFANLNQGMSWETGWNTVRTLSNTFDHITQEALIYNAVPDGGTDVVDNIFADVGNTSDGVIAMLASAALPTYTTNDANMIRGGSQGTFCGLATCPVSTTTAPAFAANGNGTGLGADYRLCAASAIPLAACGGISGIANSGTTLASFSNDKIGTSRPQGASWSIGAFEESIPPTQPGPGDGLLGLFQ